MLAEIDENLIRRDATRAKAPSPDLDRVAGTSLDKGAELEALASALRTGRLLLATNFLLDRLDLR